MGRDIANDVRFISERLSALEKLLTHIEAASISDSKRLAEALSRVQVLEANIKRLRARLGVPEEQ